jgi:nucleoside phosphorylase
MNAHILQMTEREQARQRIDSFFQRFDQPETYRLLARHAALPLSLTLELLNYINNQFLRGQVPWVAEVDLLLSNLCVQVGYEQFAMDPAVRELLLDELKQDPGPERMRAIARLVLQYIRLLPQSSAMIPKHERQAQAWAAMVYLDAHREQAIREIVEAFRGCILPATADRESIVIARSEMDRLARITQALASELGQYPQLVQYATDVGQIITDQSEVGAARLRREVRLRSTQRVMGQELPALVGLIKQSESSSQGLKPQKRARNTVPSPTHLHTTLLLVTVTKVESHAVLQVFEKAGDRKAQPTTIDNRIYLDLGTINSTRVFLMQSEMDIGGLSIVLQALQKGIEALAPAAVIMVGIAFGVNEQKQSIGDVLVSKQLWLYDLQRLDTGKIILRGDKPRASGWLVNYLRGADPYWEGAKVRFGVMLTGERLVDNLAFRDQLGDLEPEVIGGEMEGAGLYLACQAKKVDWILVKAIYDWGDGPKAQNKDERQILAARNAASFVLHALQFAPLELPDARLQSEAYMSTANPYNYNLPVAPEMFFGRIADVEHIAKQLLGTPGDSVAVIGGRRMGRTSLLEALLRILEHDAKESASTLLPVPIFLDLRGEGIDSAVTFFRTTCDQIETSLGGVLNLTSKARGSITGEHPPAPAFRGILENWGRLTLSQTGRHLRVILILDEYDKIVEQPWASELHAALRSLLVGQSTRSALKLVIAGSQPFLTQVRQRGEPLWNVLSYHLLRVLDSQATYDLITRPCGRILADALVRAVAVQSGGHPFLTQYVMHHLWRAGLHNVTVETVSQIAAAFVQERNDFQDWMNGIGKTGERVYQALTKADKTLTESEIRALITPAQPDTPQALATLCYYGVVVHDSVSGSYSVAGQMFRAWFETNRGADHAGSSASPHTSAA